MRFFLISSSNDTLTGMRLAGIEGVMAKTEDDAKAALESAIADPTVGVVLITEPLVGFVADRMYELKQNSTCPLIVEIPDRHSTGRAGDSITRYVREAVGIKV